MNNTDMNNTERHELVSEITSDIILMLTSLKAEEATKNPKLQHNSTIEQCIKAIEKYKNTQ
jgi:hypothetical protein